MTTGFQLDAPTGMKLLHTQKISEMIRNPPTVEKIYTGTRSGGPEAAGRESGFSCVRLLSSPPKSYRITVRIFVNFILENVLKVWHFKSHFV